MATQWLLRGYILMDWLWVFLVQPTAQTSLSTLTYGVYLRQTKISSYTRACKALLFERPQTPVPGRPWSIAAPGRVASPSHQSSGTFCAAPAILATATDIARDGDGAGRPTRGLLPAERDA